MTKDSLFILFFLISCIFILEACQDANIETAETAEEFLEAFEQEINLESEIFIDDTVSLLRPFYFRLLENYFVFIDQNDAHHGSIYDPKSKEIICRILQNGKGPNEYVNPKIHVLEDKLVVIDEANIPKLHYFSKEGLLSCKNEPDTTILLKRPKSDDQISNFFTLDREKIIATGSFSQGRYHYFNESGNFENSFGEYPYVQSQVEYDNRHLGFIFEGRESLQFSSKLSKLASISRSTLSLFDYNSTTKIFEQSLMLNWHTPIIKEATYKDGKPYVIRIGNGAIVGAGNLAANDDFLFFPFCKDEFREMSRQGIRDFYNYILVMNWEGEPVARLKLDKRIQFPLEIDESGRHLYSTHVDLEKGFTQILEFDIGFLSDEKL
ncbi:MAG: BF3164 family lipoprotein [Cytophagales bacterium]|nr:BF3164 family lipoprotein [Cytophagales bacterium]